MDYWGGGGKGYVAPASQIMGGGLPTPPPPPPPPPVPTPMLGGFLLLNESSWATSKSQDNNYDEEKMRSRQKHLAVSGVSLNTAVIGEFKTTYQLNPDGSRNRKKDP